MSIDVDKVRVIAADMAGAAATAANEIAEQAQPMAKQASEKVDELAEKGRPYVEQAEKAAEGVIERVKDAFGGKGGGAF